MSYEQAKQYLAKVIPWPQDGEPAFVDICTTFVPEEGLKDGQKLPWGGRAVRSLDEAIKAIDWSLKQPATRDVYVCMSTQRQAKEKTGKNNYRYFTPIRNQRNAVALKSLFIDVDFKGGEHGYDTKDEAIREIARFLKETSLPKPSILVLSGGGVHVYWTMVGALTLEEWRPLAYALAEATKRHGLKCDSQCTVDGARVLRVPDTFNHKLATPRPVTLGGNGLDFDYSVEVIAKALEPYKTIAPQHAPTVEPINLPPPRPSLLAKFKVSDDMSAGLEREGYTPFKIEEIAGQCAFVRDALASGGLTYTQPEWNLTTLIATFAEGARADAHSMGNKHPGYSKEATDALYDRKEREKAEKGLGWPSCASISAAGCKACQGCKHFVVGKTPMHAALSARVVQPSVAKVTPPVSPNWDVPKGYHRDSDGVISRIITDKDGNQEMTPIAMYSMENPQIFTPPSTLYFEAKIAKGRKQKVCIELEKVGTMEMRQLLQKQDFMCPVGPKGMENLARFMMSWIKVLQDTRDAVHTVAFGWNRKGSPIEGFVFDGKMWTPQGAAEAGRADPVLETQYGVKGDMSAWREASKMITDQLRPQVNALLASAFAAPLVEFSGEPGVIISSYSKESGAGKSTALKVAQAVWGDTVNGVMKLNDTSKGSIKKLEHLRSLPMYWDEIKTDVQRTKLVDITFEVTQGAGQLRLNRDIKLREPGNWRTLFVTASNDSLLDVVLKKTKTTDAGLYRVFEFIVDKPKDTDPGRLITSDVSRLTAELQNNHGHAGEMYSEFLGKNHAAVSKEMAELMRELGKEVKTKDEERFWMAGIASVVLGARYANALGLTAIDEPALKHFLLHEALEGMRERLASETVNLNQEFNLADVIIQYVKSMQPNHVLFTDKMHMGTHKPAAGSIKVDAARTQVTKLASVAVHFATVDKMLRLARAPFVEWLAGQGYSPSVILKQLAATYGARPVQGIIAGGTNYHGTGQERLYEIDLHLAKSLDAF